MDCCGNVKFNKELKNCKDKIKGAIDMQNNGDESMANMMKSVGRDNMVKFHQSMMGR